MGLFYLEFNMNKKINDIASEAKNGELLALVDPKDLKDPLENTKWS